MRCKVLRQFAAEQLDGDEELLIAGRHLEWFLAWLGRHRPALRGGDQAAAVSAIAADIENVRSGAANLSADGRTGGNTASPPLAGAGRALHFDMRSWFLEGETTFRHAAEMAGHGLPPPAGSRHDLVVLTAQLDAPRLVSLPPGRLRAERDAVARQPHHVRVRRRRDAGHLQL